MDENAEPRVDTQPIEPYCRARRRVTDAFELAYLRDLLERTRGNVSAAARMAEMDRSWLIKLMKKHGGLALLWQEAPSTPVALPRTAG
jgi:DNA-binding NtrC family response regulator